MSLLTLIKAQFGKSNTPANNFVLDASADNGTMKLARGNAGATTQDILTVDAAGKVSFTPADNQRPIGVGQTWQNMTASRVINTNYTNNTGRPIQVFVSGQASSGSQASLSVDGVLASSSLNNITGYTSVSSASAIVPAGAVYRAGVTGTLYWSELR